MSEREDFSDRDTLIQIPNEIDKDDQINNHLDKNADNKFLDSLIDVENHSQFGKLKKNVSIMRECEFPKDLKNILMSKPKIIDQDSLKKW